MNEKWYTLEKNNGKYTIWYNQEFYEKDKCGSIGSLGIFTARTKKECLEYCSKKGIKIKKP